MARIPEKRPRCRISHKIKFSNEKQALSYARKWKRDYMTAYRCRHCDKFHLTSGERGRELRRLQGHGLTGRNHPLKR